jgi:pyridoxamine 5'-phosphate oxidase
MSPPSSPVPPLSPESVDPDPLQQVARWYDEARAAMGDDADAMVVATVGAGGAPSARVVLLRGLDERGLRFYTNRESRKGRELDADARAAIVLHWPPQGRQVRATGRVERVSDEDSRAYWNQRPRASRLSAWASRQSEPIADRAALEAAVDEVAARFGEGDVPLPPFWGGYVVIPDEIELWEHRDDRLHDRVRYRREREGWVRTRLQP